MVEDDIATGEVLSDVLEDAGYDVTLASGGSQALQLLDQQPFAVVVSDIRMPAVSGIDVLQAARQTSAQPEVILLTGYGALETSLSALRQGAFDYLLKPCDPELLIQRVAEAISARDTRLRQVQAVQNIVHAFGDAPNQDEVLIERMPQPDSSEEEQDEQQVWQVGELSFGEAHHDASFRGEPLHLTPTEHTLLRAMASKPGKVFQYRELVYAMHGYDVSNIEAKILLKTHIRNIRHKIGPDYLVNVRSTGYKLVAPEEEPAC
jgi:DNA-binding response OmpR family regulator